MQRIIKEEEITKLSNIISNGAEMEKLNAALRFLRISEENFKDIHTVDLKIEYLNYRYLKKEFDLIKVKVKKQISDELLQQALDLAEKAYYIAHNSSYIKNHVDEYSLYSYGLSELDMISLYEGETVDASLSANQSIFAYEDKTSGVEPGFKAMHAKDLIFFIVNKYPTAQQRQKFIENYDGNIEKIYQEFKHELPKYLYKLDYNSESGKLTRKKSNLQQTAAARKAYKNGGKLIGAGYVVLYRLATSTTSDAVNLDAATESLTSDLFRYYGLDRLLVHKQTLQRDKHKNMQLKLMLKSVLEETATPFQPLAGSQDDQNYLVKPALLPIQTATETIEFLSDCSIKYLAEFLLIFYYVCNRDAFGSEGQNKLILNGKLFIIDCGHAFESNLLDKITADFRIQDKTLKNIAIFYDALRKLYVIGLIRLAIAAEIPIADEVLKSYGEDFYQLALKLKSQPRADEKIFEDYIRKFERLKQTYQEADSISKQDRECCDKIINHLKMIKAKASHVRNKLIEKFSHYLSIESKTVDLLENMEKAMAAGSGDQFTSLLSPDKKVLLNHIRITDKFPPIAWNIHVDPNTKRHEFTTEFTDEKMAITAYQALLIWVPLARLNKKKMTIILEKNELDQLCTQLTEDKLKIHYHKTYFDIYTSYKHEIELDHCLKALEKCGAVGSVAKHPTIPNRYRLTIAPQDKVFNPEIVPLLEPLAGKSFIPSAPLFIEFYYGDIEKIIYKIKPIAIQFTPKQHNDGDLRFLELTEANMGHRQPYKNLLDCLNLLYKNLYPVSFGAMLSVKNLQSMYFGSSPAVDQEKEKLGNFLKEDIQITHKQLQDLAQLLISIQRRIEREKPKEIVKQKEIFTKAFNLISILQNSMAEQRVLAPEKKLSPGF